jgi:hypothetical protein
MQETAAGLPATHPGHPCDGSCNHQGRTASFVGQASRWFRPQHVLLQWEHQGIPCTHFLVLCIIKQKGLNVQCRKLGKAVVKLTRTFNILLKAAGSKDTVLLDDDVEARKLEIKETQKMLQET